MTPSGRKCMKIILANPRGFCAGVNMAIDSLERALKLIGAPLYVYHEIVHNRHVVDRFRKRGVVFVDRIDDIPAGANVPSRCPSTPARRDTPTGPGERPARRGPAGRGEAARSRSGAPVPRGQMTSSTST